MARGEPLGLLAGAGRLPLMAARAVKAAGRPVFAVQAAEAGASPLARVCAQYELRSVGQVGAILDFFRRHAVREVLVVGKFDKRLNFAEIQFDETAMDMLTRLPNRSDTSIFQIVAAEFQRQGMHVASQLEVLANNLAPAGHLAGPEPSGTIPSDARLGLQVATALADYDVGQTVVIKQGVVIAVEAAEHTDACIARAGKLAGRGFVVCKVARPRQDPRFDVPIVGPDTLRVMGRFGAACLAVEAGRTVWLDQKKCVTAAARLGITMLGLAPAE
jgi:DUF1009 family protein